MKQKLSAATAPPFRCGPLTGDSVVAAGTSGTTSLTTACCTGSMSCSLYAWRTPQMISATAWLKSRDALTTSDFWPVSGEMRWTGRLHDGGLSAFAYDEAGNRDKEEREQAAAKRLFNLLPDKQAVELRALWDEFEARETGEARYAAALDRFQPILLNCHTEGAAWRKHGVKRAQVIARNEHIKEGIPALWDHALEMIDEAVASGHLGK